MTGIINIFARLDRLGPGSVESLRWALNLAGTPADGTVLDAGCGTGADLPALASAVRKGRVVAIDTAEPFVARVRKRFPKVEAHVGTMLEPPTGPYDLIWAAGAVYNVGVEAALGAWRAHLAPQGRVAFSDLCWRTMNPPASVVDYFKADGVNPVEASQLEDRIRDAGWRVLGARWLGTAGWSSYYVPLEAALDGLPSDDPLVAQLRKEIDLWCTHGATYGYRILVCEPA